MARFVFLKSDPGHIRECDRVPHVGVALGRLQCHFEVQSLDLIQRFGFSVVDRGQHHALLDRLSVGGVQIDQYAGIRGR
jgi:hypothetical protein